MSLKGKKVLVYDHGLYTYLACKLGESFGKVYYYVPIAEPFPHSSKAQIGEGLEEIERIHSPWEYLDEVDAVVFFDVYDGKLQHFLRSKGYRVFGSGLSESVETDKVFFREMLKKVGLPVTEAYTAEGLEDLVAYLEKHKDKWLKTSYYRGDFETFHHRDLDHSETWLDDLRARIGKRAKEIEVIVEDPIEAACEVGYDGFCLNGEFAENASVGYEIKDQGIVQKVFPKMPKVLSDVNAKMAPIYKKLGYQGCYSTEVRITKEGKPYFIDPTCRAASPPSELLCELYENYAEVVWSLANGEMPELEPIDKFGAEIILASPWHESHELAVEMPKDATKWLKLKNHTKLGKKYFCIPNDCAGIFGAVIATGSSLKEATELAVERVQSLDIFELEFDANLFDKAAEQVASGERFGIKF